MPAGRAWDEKLIEKYSQKIREGLSHPSLPTHGGELARAMGMSRSTLGKQVKALGLSDEAEAAYEANKAERRRLGYDGTRGFVVRDDAEGNKSPTYEEGGAYADAQRQAIERTVEESGRKDEPVPDVVGATARVEPDIEEIRRENARRHALKAARARQKRHQRIRFPHGPVAVVFLGDQHIGNAGTDTERMFAEQEKILATPATYVWQMGDVVDQFILGRLIAENWKPSLPVQEQWWLAEHYMAGFRDRLLAVNAGNHDAWAQKASGVDRMRDITPDGVLYDSDKIRATVEVGNRRFRVWTRHKWRGKSMYNMTHGQERGARFDEPDHDVYVGAHLHTGSVSRDFIHNGRRKLAIQTGSYKIHDDYADAEGFPGHDSSTACTLILHDSGTFFAVSDLQAALEYMTAVYRP